MGAEPGRPRQPAPGRLRGARRACSRRSRTACARRSPAGVDDAGAAKLLVTRAGAAARARPARALHRYAPGRRRRRGGRPRAGLRPRRRGHRGHPAPARPRARAAAGATPRWPCPPGEWGDALTGRTLHRRRHPSPSCWPTCPVALLVRSSAPLETGARPRSTSGRRAPRSAGALQVGRTRASRCAAATTAGGRPTGPAPTGEVDYGYLVDDADDGAARPALAAPARRRPRAARAPSTPPRTSGPTTAWTGRQLAGSVIYELHVGTFTPEGTLDAALGRLDHLRSHRRRPRRADAGQRLQRHPQLGLRRRPLVGRARAVRRPGGLPALRRRLPRRRPRRHPGRRLQPPRPVGQLPAACSGPTSSRAPTPGATWSTSTARAATRCAASSSTTCACGSPTTTSTGCGSTPCTRCRTSPPVHLLEEMAVEVAALSAHQRRPLTLIAESDLNDPHLVTPREAGGYGLDAQWSDDFHHAVHVALTGETEGYYADFEPLSALGKVLDARVLPRRHLQLVPRPPARGAGRHRPDARWRLVVASQNHDQIGNRARGDRLTEALDDDQLACAALLTLASPVHPDALPGRGVGGLDAVPVLHLPPRARARAGDRRGAARGVRADGLGPGGRARPAGPGDLPAVPARLGRARPPGGTRCCSGSTAGWRRCVASCPS